MAIDNGPTIIEGLTKAKYVKSSSQGYTFTKEGVEWLVTALQELYLEVEKLHKELDHLWSINHPVVNVDRSDNDCQDDPIQPEQDE